MRAKSILSLLGLVFGLVGHVEAQTLKDPKDVACVIFSTDADTPVYDILLQPPLIEESLTVLARPSAIKSWLENYFLQYALPYYKLNDLGLDDLRYRVNGWKSDEAIQKFTVDEEALRQKIQAVDVQAFTATEKALLIYGAAAMHLAALRQAEDPQQQACLISLETQIEASLPLNEAVLTFDLDYRDQMLGLAQARFLSITQKPSEVFDELRARIIDPLAFSTFKDADAEIDWLSRSAGKRLSVYEMTFTLKQFAFLNVLDRAILNPQPPQAYRWTPEDLSDIEGIVKRVRGSLSPEVKETIVRRSRQYAMVLYSEQQRSQRPERVIQALKDDRLVFALGGASLAAWAMSFDYVKINRGYWRLQSDFIDQAKLNLPTELKGVAAIDDQLKNLIQNAKTALPASANAAFVESIRMGRLQHLAVERFKGRYISVFGENAWSKFVPSTEQVTGAAPVIRERVFNAGSQILDEVSMRRLSGALSTLEAEGAVSVRQAARQVRAAMDANPARALTDIKAWRVVEREAYREIRAIGKAALAEEYIASKVGANALGRATSWLRYQSRLARANFWSFPMYKGWRVWNFIDKIPYADRVPFLRRALEINEFRVSPSGLRQGLSGFFAAGEEVAAGSRFTKVLPGEGLAASGVTLRSFGRSVLHAASWIVLLYSIGQVTYDGIQAYRIRSPQEGFEDARKQAAATPEDAQVELAIRDSQLSALKSELLSALDSVQVPNEPTFNRARILANRPELEVVVNAESMSDPDVATGFSKIAYVLFKVREPARDGTLEIRRENALSGILVRFRFENAKAEWVYDHAVPLLGLDVAKGGNARDAIRFENFSMGSTAPKIIIDPQAAKNLFNRSPLF